MRPCCLTECDMSLIMGFCPKRAGKVAVRGGLHPGPSRRHMPTTEAPAEALVWPKPEPLLEWAERAKPGERRVYFTGFLATTPSAAEIGRAAAQLVEAGAVVLFQKRRGPERFDYIAERRRGGQS